MKLARAALAALMLTSLAACPDAIEGECEDGATLPCYGGPEATAGIGVCKQGTKSCAGGAWGICIGELRPHAETCDGEDNDCNGATDEGVANACGGCGSLVAAPGDACENCGTWACATATRLECLPPVNIPGAACTGVDGCAGVYQCGQDGRVSCSVQSKNACGVCGGPVVARLGEACASADGCTGKLVCNASGTDAVCDAKSKNDCGICGGTPVDGLGVACASNDGCPGLTICNPAGTAAVCGAPSKNVCSVCAPPVTGVGAACTATGGCSGNLVCDAAGTGTVCQAASANNCGVCGASNVAGIGQACTTTQGCTGINVCNSTGTGAVCNAPAANACNLCGGAVVTGLGTACVDAGGCSGQLVCNAAGTGSVCQAPSCGNGGLVISEFSGGNFSAVTPGAVEGTDEFIELYNAGNLAVDISGAALWYRPATGTNPPILLVNFPAGTTVQPRHYVLIGKRAGASSPGYVGPPAADFTYSAVDISGSTSGGAQVWLTSTATVPVAPTDAHVVDMLGWGSANVFEGSAAAPVHAPTGGSIERKARATYTGWDGAVGQGTMGPGGLDSLAGNGYDSDNNSADFVKRQVRGPQNSQSVE